MKNPLKISLSVVAVIVLGYFVYFFGLYIKYGHSHDWKTYKQYMWVYKDSVLCDVDTFGYSCVGSRDVYNNFHYRGITYSVAVWEFKDLNTATLNNIFIHQNVNLDEIEFKSGEILNAHSDMELTVKYGFVLKGAMHVNVDKYSTITKYFEGSNYKGFYGTINRISLANTKHEPQILIDYANGKTPTAFLVYKGRKSFFVIIINSENSFDPSIINILNLK